MNTKAVLAAVLPLVVSARLAHADAPSLFGQGARSAGVARADVAGGEGADAPRTNAALAASPGVRLRLAYGYGALGLRFNGSDVGVTDASGIDLTAQFGTAISKSVAIGAALSIYLPDRHLAAISFRPATEPQFVLYEASLQRTAVDMVGAVRLGPIAFGGGVAATVAVGGDGTQFLLGQDARGTFADAGLDVALLYRFAPIVGVRADLGRVSVAASARGPLAIDVKLDSLATIDLNDSPLDGDTTVRVTGTSGFDPAVITAGGRVVLGAGFAALASLEYAFYSAADPPVADVDIAVNLGTTPSQRKARFILPRFRDTLTPRLGVELRRPSSDEWRWAARAGYALAPSPVPRQTGFTTYADATRHQVAFGGGYHFGKVAGVDLAVDLAGQLHVLAKRVEDKASASLPYAHFDVSGAIFYGAATLEAAWR